MLVDPVICQDERIQRVHKGGYEIPCFNPDLVVWGRNDFERSFFDIDPIYSYGVVDSPQQFFNDFVDILEVDERLLAVFFTHIEKDPSNKGNGGGWRWHKWGEYFGHGTPRMEYLDDEEGFDDGVYTFHILIVDNLEIEDVS